MHPIRVTPPSSSRCTAHFLLLQKAREAGLDTSDEEYCHQRPAGQSDPLRAGHRSHLPQFYDTYPSVSRKVPTPWPATSCSRWVATSWPRSSCAARPKACWPKCRPNRHAADLARVHSTCPSGREGGSLGGRPRPDGEAV